MVKMLILLTAPGETDHDAFVERLREDHAPMAAGMPGVQRYVTSVPDDPEKSAYDAVSELWFDSKGDMAAAFDSEAGAAVQADADEFVAEQETLVVDEAVHVD
jgi:uncharacterized protein (TIGR02118 family)